MAAFGRRITKRPQQQTTKYRRSALIVDLRVLMGVVRIKVLRTHTHDNNRLDKSIDLEMWSAGQKWRLSAKIGAFWFSHKNVWLSPLCFKFQNKLN